MRFICSLKYVRLFLYAKISSSKKIILQNCSKIELQLKYNRCQSCFLLIPRLFAPLFKHSKMLCANSHRSSPVITPHSSISSLIVVIAFPSWLNLLKTSVFNDVSDIWFSLICESINHRKSFYQIEMKRKILQILNLQLQAFHKSRQRDTFVLGCLARRDLQRPKHHRHWHSLLLCNRLQ